MSDTAEEAEWFEMVQRGVSWKNFINTAMICYMIYSLTAVGLPPGASSTVHIYTQTTHRTTKNKQYTQQHKHLGRVQTVPGFCGLYPDICFTTEEKARINLSQGRKTSVSVALACIKDM
jgi:hypothetical protein